MGSFFAYARVSTSRQGEKGVSLQEQRAAIERYAASHGLQITRWFEERESASQVGRPAFMEMLRLLHLGKVQGVIIHNMFIFVVPALLGGILPLALRRSDSPGLRTVRSPAESSN